MNLRYPAIFVLGALTGALAMSGIHHSRHPDPVMSSSGRVLLDTATHEDARLNNAVFIDNPDAPLGRMFLRFSDDKTMNAAIGKEVTVTGSLHAVQLGDGRSIMELQVGELNYRP